MNREFLIELMIANTDFSIDEIMEMQKWEMLSYLGLD